ncbi:M48 family metallopeptidase [Paracoccus benzoatiresistens]|uniref:M48 family metallopeptidase n=1 Tax=Paracoccus benzoatiresistens TaxID=2997341 RepID=A0ABT4JBN1_9RHOB|nr:M48 family metallopeptidase [Paracoccus sp. EF6]MCZ0964516.1 M48 family metallopeptidase [Paracoccus sp. EF6]
MTLFRFLRAAAVTGLLGFVAACGTTYQMPGVDDAVNARASAMFAEAKAAPPRRMTSADAGEARFLRVASRIQPVAEQLCQAELAAKGADCRVKLELDRQRRDRNAYFTYAGPGNSQPVIRFTVPMLQDVESDDEVAFILGHEYGHLIGQHIVKQQQQAIAGALILGVLTAYGNAQAASAGQGYDPNAVSRNMEIGAAVGGMAYSQTYELESDMLGTRIATAAGYDPVRGARFFARDEAARSETGQLSFWGTHPADAKRLAVVLATVDQIKAGSSAAMRK